ncbi:MAG: hypothetical protein HFH97_13595 [Lachnospiraceae bacterium]|nr:hypothetical protein [uncultured Acetatifactor sp.]MCI9573613.1 hypothetical protein [Lachnospiraceae bacterium]
MIEKNAVFHTVRETQDHGAFNSWAAVESGSALVWGEQHARILHWSDRE